MPNKNIPTFAEYSSGWWDLEKCEYLREQNKRKDLTLSYVEKSHAVLDNQLIPYFGKMKLDKITPEVIEKWFDKLVKEEVKNSTINGYYAALMTMLKWAVKKKVIKADPTREITKLKDDCREIKISTQKEFKALFVKDWRKVWDNNLVFYAANKLAALTGMRASELLGLRGEYVHDDHIYVCAQYDRYGYRPTKTKDKNNIVLAPEMIADLKELMKANGVGYVFSDDGGRKPVSHKRLRRGYCKALANIGMKEAEIEERGLCLHGWRHFCNTELQKGGLTITQVQAVTRHKTKRMTERYSHFNPSDFTQVTKVQSDLLQPEPEKETGKKPSAKIRIVKPETAAGLQSGVA